jgi:hypothetical protein
VAKLALNGALEREDACVLFTRGAPERLRVLDLFAMDLGDWATAPLAAAGSRWLERLTDLNVEMNGLSDKALASLLDRLVEHAPELVTVSVKGNRLGASSYARLERLEARGVAIDVSLPAKRAATRAAASVTDPVDDVSKAWARIDAFLARHELSVPGLGAAAPPARLARASLPPSLAALHAAHDGMDGIAEVLGLGKAVWWPLGERDERLTVDDRSFVVFGAPLGDDESGGDVPEADADLEEVLAVDLGTEEVVLIDTERDLVTTVAEGLGTALGAVADALDAGTLVIDENGRLQPPAAASAPVEPRSTAVTDLARLLVANAVVELRAGATEAELAGALGNALRKKTKKARVAAVLAVFESDPLVDEVFADEEQLRAIAEALA